MRAQHRTQPGDSFARDVEANPSLWENELDRKRLFQTTFALSVAGGVLAGGSTVARAATRQLDAVKTSMIAAQNAPSASLNPDAVGYASQAILSVYDGLTDVIVPADFDEARKALNSKGLGVVPKLASSWTISGDRKVYTLKLRTNAKSPFGNTMTSADVLWSIDKWINGSQLVAKLLAGLGGLTDKGQATAPNASTVQIAFRDVPPTFILPMLGLIWLTIYDSTEIKKHTTAADPFGNTWLPQNAAGFGPYRVVSNSATGDQTVFNVNSGYWGAKPAIPKVTRLSIIEPSTRLQILLSGAADFADELTAVQYDSAEKNKKYQVTSFMNTRSIFIGFDDQKSPFDNPTIRKGIARAIPYDDIVKFVYRGRAKRWKTHITAWFPGATDDFWKYDTNISVAKTMLAPIKDVPLTLNYAAGSPAGEQTAILVQQGLRSAGVNVSIAVLDPNTFTARLGRGELAFRIDEQSGPSVVDTGYLLALWFKTNPIGRNTLKYRVSPEVDALSQQAIVERDRDKFLSLVRQIQQKIVPDMPFVPIASTGSAAAHIKELQGFRSHLIQFPVYQDLAYKAAAPAKK